MMTFVETMTCDLITDFEPASKWDNIRVGVAEMLLNEDLLRPTDSKDSGLYGKVFELLYRSPKSQVTRVQPQGKIDLYITVNGKRCPCEVKTNCGRIGSLYKVPAEKMHDTYVLYSICREKPAGKHLRKDGTYAPAEEWYLPPILMSVADFLADAERFKAVTSIGHNATDEEPNVRGDKGAFYRYLLNRKSTYYVRGTTYTTIL